MSEWQEGALAEFCRSIEDGDWIETKDQDGHDYRLIQVSNVGLGRFRETGNYRYVSDETFTRLRCRQVHVGQVLVARMPDPVGRAWFVDRLDHRAITSVDVAIVDTNPNVLSPQFCAYLLNSPMHLAIAASSASGTTRLRVTRKQVASRLVRVPDRATQDQVVHVLGSLDDLIENSRRRIELLEQIAQATYREWFVNFRYPGHEDASFVDSPLGPIPEGWRVGELQNYLVLQRGFDLPTSQREFGDIAIIGASGIQGSHSTAKVQGPGVCTGRSGTIGKVTYAPGPYWPLNTTLWVKQFKAATPLFAYFLLQSIDLKELAGGAAVPSLNRNHIHGLPVVIAPAELIKEWTASADPMFRQIAILRAKSDRLASARDLLLPQLVTGQIDVSGLDLGPLHES